MFAHEKKPLMKTLLTILTATLALVVVVSAEEKAKTKEQTLPC